MSTATRSKPIERNKNEEDHASSESSLQTHLIKRIPTRDEIEQRAYELFFGAQCRRRP
jgi:hypothetical protein